VEFFTCYTLVDITCTGINDPVCALPYQQQQNFNTFLQFIGLRTQPLNIDIQCLEDQALDQYKFGSRYTGSARVWKLTWSIETLGYVGISELRQDSDGVPVHTHLTETVELVSQVLESKNTQRRNLYFVEQNKST